MASPAHSDSAIKRSAESALLCQLGTQAEHVVVLVCDGVVTLTGRVPWTFQRAAARETVRTVEGVRRVIDEIEVRTIQPT